MSSSDWWKGRAWGQDTHARINVSNFPGSRQLCSECGDPTGRCEDDTIDGRDGPICEACREEGYGLPDDDYEPTEIEQGLIPIPRGYNEQ